MFLYNYFEAYCYGGGYCTRFEPETKGLVKKRMTVDEYLAHQPEEETADSWQISSILDSEVEVWERVHWRLSEELFLFWYIWLRDNFGEMRGWVEEVKRCIGATQANENINNSYLTSCYPFL